MGKRLLITSTDLMMVQFLVPHVRNLAEYGFEVEIACSDVSGCSAEIRESLGNSVKAVYTVSLDRSPVAVRNIKGARELEKIIDRGDYDLIWTNEPVMGAVTRIAARKARKRGIRVIYMVHGFHFYKGAPIKNWLLFYPIERQLAHLTDCIVTLNREDYIRAGRFPVKGVYYIHGIGADTDRLQRETISQNIRKKLQIPENAFLILSVGELNRNKNHKAIIKALSLLHDTNIYYVICGSGRNLKKLQEAAEKCGIAANIRLVNYRRDIINFYDQADLFILPSHREGMPVALLEAMYCGVPAVASDIRGVRDVMKSGVTGLMCSPDDSRAFAAAIKKLKNDAALRKEYGRNSRRAVKPYMLSEVKDAVMDIFTGIGDRGNESDKIQCDHSGI